MNYDINTRQELWRWYGGHAAVGQRFGITRRAVDQYTARGIKQGWHGRIILDLTNAGMTWNPEIFGLEEHPGAFRLNQIIAGIAGDSAPPAAA